MKNKETLEEVVDNMATIFNNGFIRGAKWQQQQMYSEEDLRRAFNVGRSYLGREGDTNFEKFIEQFKKK